MKRLFPLWVILVGIYAFSQTSNTIKSSNPGAGVTFNGYKYSTVVLGNGQEWMAENLRTTTYANGDPIPNVTASSKWNNKPDANGNRALGWADLTTGAWAHYNNDSQYENPYGKLYNGFTITDPRNVCPTGWHVPNNVDWVLLINHLGGEPVAGGKMKSTGTQYWESPNTAATNESGFSAVPSGFRDEDGFYSLGKYGSWWSATTDPYNDDVLYNFYLDYEKGNVVETSNYRVSAHAIRCIMD